MERHNRFELTLIGVEILESVMVSVLAEAKDWDPPLGTVEVAYRAGLPAPRDRQAADFVLRQLEKAGRVQEIKQGRRKIGWRLTD